MSNQDSAGMDAEKLIARGWDTPTWCTYSGKVTDAGMSTRPLHLNGRMARVLDGRKQINEAYERGLTPAQLYKPFDPLYRAMCSFIDTDYFGLLMWDEEKQAFIPKHVNGDNNPYAGRDYWGRKARRKFRKADLLCHLFSQPYDPIPRFAFMVNSPHRHYHLLCLDIDANDPSVAHKIVADLIENIFPEHLVFTEYSRNRNGMYCWIIVKRTSSPQEFNKLMNAFGSFLRHRYVVDQENKFDAVKGTLHYHDGDEFDKLLCANPNDSHRGVLATMPLSGSACDGEDGVQRQLKSSSDDN